jgi:hypothetical protein
VGALAILSENSDGTFTGMVQGTQGRGSVTAFSIQFEGDWATPTGLTGLGGIDLPVVQSHHVGYSGSLYSSGSGYRTSGSLYQSTALCYQDEGVCTYITGTRTETYTQVSGVFAHS